MKSATSIFIPDKKEAIQINPLQILEALCTEERKKKYSRVPDHARPRIRFTDQTTNGLTTAILEAFRVHGIFATRLDSKGTYSAKIGRFIPSRQRAGMPDISAILGGRAVYVEVKCKATRDRLRPAQAETIERLRASGAAVCLAEDFAGFWTWLKEQIHIMNNSSQGQLPGHGMLAMEQPGVSGFLPWSPGVGPCEDGRAKSKQDRMKGSPNNQ